SLLVRESNPGAATGLAAVCAAALCLVVSPAIAQSAFYQATKDEHAGPPGTIIRPEPMPFRPSGASAFRVIDRRRHGAEVNVDMSADKIDIRIAPIRHVNHVNTGHHLE